MNPISNQLMRAVLAQFEADRQEALAIVELYLNAPVGIGDHPSVVGELTTATQKLAAAEEGMEALKRNFISTTDAESENE
jgi:hypothetical protein